MGSRIAVFETSFTIVMGEYVVYVWLVYTAGCVVLTWIAIRPFVNLRRSLQQAKEVQESMEDER